MTIFQYQIVKLPDQWPCQEPKLEVTTIYKAYFSGLNFREHPHKIWSYMVLTYLHFRILKFPLIKWSFNREHDDSPEDLGQTNGVCGHNLGWYFVAYGSFRNGTSTTTRESMEMFFCFFYCLGLGTPG